MATDLERLVVQLSADTKQYQNALNKALGVTNRQAGAIEKRFRDVNKNVSGSIIGIGRLAAGAFAGSAVVREFTLLSEAATRIDNSLKVAGISGSELERVYQALSKAAKDNGAPIEALANLYGKAAQAQKELGVSSDELITFSANVALALRVAGTDAQSASGALLQLGQALGSGKVQAEEFNSILEGAPTIAQAVAAGLKEAGGSVSQLKALVVDGKISSEAFFRAFEAGAVILEQKAANATFTLGGATENLWTALTSVVREFNNSTGASENFAKGINSAADAVGGFDVSGMIQQLRNARGELDGFLADFGNARIFERLNELLGVTNSDGSVVNPDVSSAQTKIAGLEQDIDLLQQAIKKNADLAIDNTEALARLREVREELARVRAETVNLPATIGGYGIGPDGLKTTSGGGFKAPFTPLEGMPAELTPRVRTVSIDDFKAPPGGKGRGGRSKDDDYEREIQQIKERTESVRALYDAQSLLNPLIDDYGFAVEKAQAKQELLTAAESAGKKITPELAQEIDRLAGAYATAVAASEQLAEKQDEIRQRAEEAMATAKDLASSMIDGFLEGEKAADILAGGLKRIGSALINDVLNSIFKVKNASGGGLLDGLFSFLSGGSAAADPWSGLRGVGAPAAGVTALSGAKALSAPALPRLATQAVANGGSPQRVDIHVDVSGARGDKDIVDMVSRGVSAGIREYDRDAGPSMVQRVINDPRARG
jgi:tape measure domain-containing protein